MTDRRADNNPNTDTPGKEATKHPDRKTGRLNYDMQENRARNSGRKRIERTNADKP